MEIGQDFVKSSKNHQSSRIAKERFPHSQGNQRSKYDRLEVQKLADPPNGGLGLDAPYKNSPHQKLSHKDQGWNLKEKTAKGGELVKYMSILPGYLQHVDKGESFQEKALNVGVLDWGRLENWKHKQRHFPAKVSQSTSCSNSSSCTNEYTMQSFSSAISDEASGNQSKLQPLSSKPSHKARSKCSKSSLDGQKHITGASKSLDRRRLDERHEKGRMKVLDQEMRSKPRHLSSSSRDSISLHVPEQRIKDLQPDITKGNSELRPKSEVSSTISISHKVSSRPNTKISDGGSDTKKIEKQLRDADISLSNEYCSSERRNIVLLFPRNSRQSILSKVTECSEPGMVPVKELTVRAENLAEESNNPVLHECSPKKVHLPEFQSEISSRPLPSKVQIDSKVNFTPQSLNTLKPEILSDASCKSVNSNDTPSMLPGKNSVEKCRLNLQNTNSHFDKDECGLGTKHVNSHSLENLKILDQETAELAGKRGRNRSPTRRFSFSLPRLSRSFSFKEASGIPQLSSTYVTVKSGPVTSEASSYFDTSNEDKGKGHRKSSPLRRFLDPLLKSKGSKSSDPPQHTETAQTMKGNSDSNSKPVHPIGSIRKGKDGEPIIQAVLQLTIKNGVPFYKFVVDNEESILAATMKTSNLPDKGNSENSYMFYSLNQIKKKSGSWITQGSKCKSSRFVSNLIGQMQFSSYSASNSAEQDSSSLYPTREFVLFGIELEEADKELQKLKPNKELAAVVVKFSSEVSSHDGQQNGKDKDCSLRGTGTSNKTTVILPGGTHSLPLKGEPSPLITRWKSGGTCDCGGWDIGCRLRILSNEKKHHKSQEMSKVSSQSERFELFDQGATGQGRPVFSLTQFEKGIYAVKFSSSVSSLQAFFICVAILSSQNLPSLSEESSRMEAKVFKEPSLGGNEKIEVASILTQGATRYILNPPHSLVERV